MTSQLIFHNPGEIDIRGACIAGLSAKDSDSPIGFFGTGLKYAIASVLRWGGEITIYSGLKRYSFHADDLDFRGQAFKQVILRTHFDSNGHDRELGFTTEYGKAWEPWQVFRELYANARDEGGTVELRPRAVRPTDYSLPGHTTIIVSGVDTLTQLFYERDEIILPLDKSWTAETADLQFSPAPCAHLYYRNVRVSDRKCKYTWNFKRGLTLTEDRTLKATWAAQDAARSFILHDCEDETIIEHMLLLWAKPSAGNASFEQSAMDYFSPPVLSACSTAFARVAARLYRREPVTFKKLRALAIEFDRSLETHGRYELNKREQAMLDRAKALVSKFGFPEQISTLPIVVQELGEDVLGKYEAGEIQLSPNLFKQGTKQLVSTLYEECYHAKTGNADCTYQMQTDLFNIIITLNEELHSEIC